VPEDFEKLYEGIIRDLYQQGATKQPGAAGTNYLAASDGTFLGKLTSNRFDADSIANQFGVYGSKFSSDSIFNQFGPYGSKFSPTSPWNEFASDPPKIYLNNQPVGVLTKNRFVQDAHDTDAFLKMVAEDPRFAW
jgi:hypothetical protein